MINSTAKAKMARPFMCDKDYDNQASLGRELAKLILKSGRKL